MTQITKPVVFQQATDSVLQAFARFSTEVKAALKSGKPLEEAVEIGAAIMKEIVPQIGNLPSIPADVKEDMFAEVRTGMLGGLDIVKALLS
jgi:hypothetical protein